MAAGLPDLVDCTRLAEDAAVLERVYALKELPRLLDLLANPEGELHARVTFALAPSGRAAATVAVRSVPQLVCQRCMQGFAFPVNSESEVEFTHDELTDAADGERELFRTDSGMVSLRDLAEEELLLALPIAPACSTPHTCPHVPGPAAGGEDAKETAEMRRPFSALRDLMKKT